ncbi:MAG: membrane protein insertase YidC [SAR86 cluster bacterium]|uniref:Membrane protein insertase YidC n=1 Tax=SAR86 cluster bacterium TaxID=2030880 RepID=A0A2A4MRM9_9GAMM|nr:MAG: membrane protein insertase YidC [SAR86 cluster bacterium]
MNKTQLIILTGLALITYLLLLAWQEDYPQVIESSPQPQAGFTNIEQVSNNTATSDFTTVSDLPSQLPASSTATSQDTPSVADTVITSSQRLISITTDAFNLSINLDGGDIVYLSLPQYLRQIDIPGDYFVLLESSSLKNYVAQSGLIGRDGVDAPQRANYTSASSSYTLRDGQDTLVVDLTLTNNGVEIIKRYSFHRDNYLIDVSYLVNNTSSESWQANAFGQIKRDPFEDPSSAGGFGRTYLGFVNTTIDDPYIEYEFDDIDDGTKTSTMTGGWVAFSQHYFVSAWIPNVDSNNRFTTRKNASNQYIGEFTSESFEVAANTSGSYSMQFYAGPTDQYRLDEISPNLGLTIDYGYLGFIASPINWLLTKIHGYIGNFGFAIILLTVVVKSIFYKLSEIQYRSMAGMRRIMPKVQQIKERYGDDKMKLQKATMELYKKEKINPFGGCLPMLVQMPVFISLYWVLLASVELRHAPFLLWLSDLSVRDPFFILPLLMGASMYFQASLSPAPADPMQAKVMKFMPVMMTAFFFLFPAGLVLYWLTNSVLGIMQQWYITRKIEAAYETKSAK